MRLERADMRLGRVGYYDPDVTLADGVLEAYAQDPEGLVMEEYADLGLDMKQAYALSEVFTAGSDFKPGDGIITPEARSSFISAGLSETFIVSLGGTDGRHALQERVKWLSDNAFTKWYRIDYEPEERAAFLEELRNAIPDPNKAADLLIKVLSFHFKLNFEINSLKPYIEPVI